MKAQKGGYMNLTLALLFVSLSSLAVSPTDGLSANVKKFHEVVMANNCELDWDFYMGPETFKIDEKTQLILVPCIGGAYQTSSVGYLVTNKDQIKSVVVLAFDELSKSIQPSFDLTNASFDESTKVLSTFAKGRGLGDCGQSSLSSVKIDKWSGVQVITNEVRSKIQCDGEVDTEWPVVFKQ